jgi:hypothetical protein
MANNGPKSLTSDDVNYLIYRYMQESGQEWQRLALDYQVACRCGT